MLCSLLEATVVFFLPFFSFPLKKKVMISALIWEYISKSIFAADFLQAHCVCLHQFFLKFYFKWGFKCLNIQISNSRYLYFSAPHGPQQLGVIP